MARSWFAKFLGSPSRRSGRKPRLARVQLQLEDLEQRITPATRTWVSGLGDDVNPGSRTAPDKTFAGAISRTDAGGEIDALDSGGFGALTITKSLTVDGGNNLASVLASGTNAIVIQAGDTDVVVLRHLKLQGIGAGLDGIRIVSAGEVHIEDCVIENFSGVGIDYVSTTAGGLLFVSNTDLLHNAGGGFLMKPNGTAGTATLDKVFALDNKFGFRVEDRGQVAISNSVASGNTENGFQNVSGTSALHVNLESDVASNNHMNGVTAEGANAQVTLSNVTASGNWGEGIATASGGNLFSFGNNHYADNARTPTTLGTGTGTSAGSATRTWVSGTGDDANPASRTAPGKTFAGALSRTTAGGEIDALDPGGFGTVTIGYALTVDGSGTFASILSGSTNGIVVNAGASDVVILRGLSLNGSNHTGPNGIRIISAGAVIIEDCSILNFQVGIDFEPTNAGAQLFVRNTVVRGNSTAGILIKPNGVAAMAALDGVQANGNQLGVQVQDNADVTISHSTATSNTTNGFEVDAASQSAIMTLESDTSSSNGGNGVLAKGPAGGSSTVLAIANLSNVSVTGNGGVGVLAAAASPADSFISAFASNRIMNNSGGDGAPNTNLFQQRFVQELYLDNLGRAASSTDVNGWVTVLNSPGNSQASVTAAIVHASESRTHLVKTWYLSYLGRAAMGGEEQGWVTQLAQGQTEEAVLSGIFGTAEYFNRAQSLVASGTQQERFVKALFLQLLNRTASAAEVSNWVNTLSQVGQAGVALQIQQSSEYRTLVVTGYYNNLLHRPPDLNGLNGFVSSSQDLNTIRIAIESSIEFFFYG